VSHWSGLVGAQEAGLEPASHPNLFLDTQINKACPTPTYKTDARAMNHNPIQYGSDLPFYRDEMLGTNNLTAIILMIDECGTSVRVCVHASVRESLCPATHQRPTCVRGRE
jgi:hypothetical protein